MTVRAAGCVVWRRAGDGIEYLLTHRPRYDDWSHPKGKRDPGETDEQTAVREVDEETGLHGALGAELSSSHYVDHKGRDKIVRYWLMEMAGGSFEPNDEVDEVRWLALGPARELVSYDRDRSLLDEAAASLGADTID